MATDQYVNEPWQVAQAGTVLVLDGLFLHRDELHELLDLCVLDVSFSVTAARMAARDGTHADPEHLSMRRYVVAQRRYFQHCEPVLRASLVIDNNDWCAPIMRCAC